MNFIPKKPGGGSSALLWAASFVLLVGLLFARLVYPELLWLTVVVGVALVAALAGLVAQNQKALRTRTAAYGLNAVVMSVLVVAIVGVLNFLASRYPQKLDLTKNKLNTLSDQTVKVVKGLQKTVKATYYAKLNQREQVRPLLENYKALSPKFEVEYVDPDREPTRAKAAGIKKYGTLQLQSGARDTKIDDPTEEKLTNDLIKLLKEKQPLLCALVGHGEKSFSSREADGYEAARKALVDQSYEVKDVNLIQDNAASKEAPREAGSARGSVPMIPENCDAVAIIGPQKPYFAPEIAAIQAYLAGGGRAVLALDMDVKGGETAAELKAMLEGWHVRVLPSIIVDPVSSRLGLDASVSVVQGNKDQPITKEMQSAVFFPFARPVETLPGAPEGLVVTWLGKTTAGSWAVADMKALASGQVTFQEGRDKRGPLDVAVAVEGKLKDSKAARKSRLAVFGTSAFGNNSYSRLGTNFDFFLNSVTWAMEDESLISIRAKDEGPGKVELSQKQGRVIGIITVLLIPALIAVAGIVIWVVRRRL